MCVRSLAQGYHQFAESEVAPVRRELLAWYDTCRRKLPWRGDTGETFGAQEMKQRAQATASASAAAASSDDAVVVAPAASRQAVSAYGVWISEIMAQQTRVDVVVGYWQRWMERFPTIASLASASLDDVNSLWAGLGYYRRAKFLHQAAQTLVKNHGGQMPNTVAGLLEVPGIGPYTAGAIASVAFGVTTPVVDGNVIRVLSRLRAIDVDPKNRAVQPLLWQLAGRLVDPTRSGDFNQAMMELGATVCTPLKPQCGTCPVRDFCHVHREVEQQARPCALAAEPTNDPASSPIVIDIEDLDIKPSSTAAASGSRKKAASKSKPPVDHFAQPTRACTFCDARASPPAATTAYPSIAKKKAPLEQHLAVTVLRHRSQAGADERYLLVKRPLEGLLAGQWEFPSTPVTADATSAQQRAALISFLSVQFAVAADVVSTSLGESADLGSLVHIFSHRKHLMAVSTTTVQLDGDLTHVARDRIFDHQPTADSPEDAQPKRPRLDGKKRPAKKVAVDDEESTDADDGSAPASVVDPVSFAPQSYRWVSLSSLGEDHKSAGGSELGLSSGVRKVVRLIVDSHASSSFSSSGAVATSNKLTAKRAPARHSKEVILIEDDSSSDA